MKQVLNEELIKEAAQKNIRFDDSALRQSLSESDFISGVSWCRKFYEELITNLITENQGLKMNQDLSIEFADWINSNEYIKTANNESKWIYWAADEEFNTKYTTEELFEEFIKERNK